MSVAKDVMAENFKNTKAEKQINLDKYFFLVLLFDL
jgi:hypothetical protein